MGTREVLGMEEEEPSSFLIRVDSDWGPDSISWVTYTFLCWMMSGHPGWAPSPPKSMPRKDGTAEEREEK